MPSQVKIPYWVWTIPYEAGGREVSGADCWGLILILYREFFSISLPEYCNLMYVPGGELEGTSESIFKEFSKGHVFQEVDVPDFGDVVLIEMLGNPVHIGFCLNSKQMIHLSAGSGVSIENFTEGKWNRKISGFYRKA